MSGPDRAARFLDVSTMCLAAVTALFLSAWSVALAVFEAGGAGSFTLGDHLGALMAQNVMFWIPTITSILTLVLKGKGRSVFSVITAIVSTAAFLGLPAGDGVFFLPLSCLSVLAVVLPAQVGKGFNFLQSRVARASTGILIMLPGLILLVSTLLGTVEASSAGWEILTLALYIMIPLACGVFVMVGKRLATLAVMVLGGLVLVIASVDTGLLTLAFWVFGGMWFALGAGAWASSAPREHGSPAQSTAKMVSKKNKPAAE